MSWLLWYVIGFVVGGGIASIFWFTGTKRNLVGDLRVDRTNDGDPPLLYLAMRSDGYEKLKKGSFVTFYVQDDPPTDI